MADWEWVVSVGTVIGQYTPIQPSLKWEHSYFVKLPRFNPIITYFKVKYDEFYLMFIHISIILMYHFISQFLLSTIQYVLFFCWNYNPKK